MDNFSPAPQPHHQAVIQLKFDWRIVTAALLLIIASMLYIWQPWHPAATKTISVRGEATIEAAPDSFQFQPIYQDEDIKKVTAVGNDVVTHLKQLGVKEADLKTSVSAAASDVKTEANGTSPAYPGTIRYVPKSTYMITATVATKELAQKIADYLATTSATGQVTPQATYSKATRSKLDLQARSQASDDAKRKAEVTAKQLGAKLGKVSKITEDTGYGLYALDSRSAEMSKSSGGPIVAPGTNEVSYSFTVVFELQ